MKVGLVAPLLLSINSPNFLNCRPPSAVRARLPLMTGHRSGFPDGLSVLSPSMITSAGWVVLFDIGTDAEGIYTVNDANSTSVVVFESVDDASEFVSVLRAGKFGAGTPVLWEASVISTF